MIYRVHKDGSSYSSPSTVGLWPLVCAADRLSLPRAPQNCEDRWFGADFFTFVATDSSGTASAVEGVVHLSQGYNPSYATRYETYSVPYVPYEAECDARSDANAAGDVAIKEMFFGDNMLFRPNQMYQSTAGGRPAMLKVHVTSETKGSAPNVKAVFRVGSVVQGTVCLHGPDTLPTDAEMNSTYQFAFPNGTGKTYKDSKGNDITPPPGRWGVMQVSQFGKELPAPTQAFGPGGQAKVHAQWTLMHTTRKTTPWPLRP